MTNQGQVVVSSGGTARVQLQARAPRLRCRRFEDTNFEFDRSFIIPEQAASLLKDISNYANQFATRRILIVGHTDTKGPSDYNLRLSKRRGMSAYAHLTGDENVWQRMYDEENTPNRKWGNREARYMLRFLKDDSGAPYFTGSPDDEGPASTNAIKHFQRDNGLDDDGIAGRQTHLAMFRKLVEVLRADGVGIPLDRFLTPQTNEFWLGCGEQHPVIPTGDEVEEPQNRRVEFLLFLQPPSPLTCDNYDSGWTEICVQSELITVEILLHNEYGEPFATEFTLQTPEGDTLRNATGADGMWRSSPNSMPPGRYILAAGGREIILVR